MKTSKRIPVPRYWPMPDPNFRRHGPAEYRVDPTTDQVERVWCSVCYADLEDYVRADVPASAPLCGGQ